MPFPPERPAPAQTGEDRTKAAGTKELWPWKYLSRQPGVTSPRPHYVYNFVEEKAQINQKSHGKYQLPLTQCSSGSWLCSW
jgi:hypothetical protein